MTKKQKPTKPCYVCGSNTWWLTPDGRWLCGQCHPNPNPEEKSAPEMVVVSDQPGESHLVPVSSSKKVYSPEILVLRDRVILGNKKLNDAWKQICKIDHESQEWRDRLEQWHQANKKLS
ncbi:unnamed protein product, partial [marine sediment metagenome]